MVVSASPPGQHTGALWTGAIANPPREFATAELPIIAGAIPPGLRGTLYRNGPARLQRGGVPVSHWFDGDGAVLRVNFHPQGARATYRYVQSAGWQAEAAADRPLYRGYGSLPPVPWWQRWQTQVKNAANTSVLALPDRLLALWEGGLPHRLDLETLETQGLDHLDRLDASDTFSAHPKRHGRTGQIFNIGLIPGGNAKLKLHRCHPSGAIDRTETIELTGIPLIHDFVLADRYLVFCVSPVRLNPLPAVFGLQSFSDALQWQPQRGTQIIVVDADSLEAIAWNQVDPWYQWHFGRSYLASDGTIVFDVVRYPDFATNQYLKEVPSGQMSTPALAQLWQYRLDPHTAKIIDRQCLLDRHCEFPTVMGEGNSALTYLNVHSQTPMPVAELFNGIAQFDPSRQTLTVAPTQTGCYPAEPIPAADSSDPQQHWVLTVVYDSQHHRSQVWIYDGHHLPQGPICRLQLPEVIPPSFHGTWAAA